ncbi:MAG TPA: DMT family transporter [Verrucomicrobiae bacterium]|nr:DMT family transporter [Verrucomicrobiae bacterium]
MRRVFAAFLTTILISISAICGHRSARLIGGTEANFWRVTFATGFLALWAFTFGQGLAGAGLPLFLISGLLGIGLGDVTYFQALPRLGPRLTLLLVQCLTAPFAALIEWLWLGTTLSLAQMLAGGVTLAGVALALAPKEHIHLSARDRAIGLAAGVVAALGGAAGAVFSRKAYAVLAAANETVDPATAGFQRVLAGCIVSGVALLIVKRNMIRREVAEDAAAPNATREKWRRVWFWIVLNSLAGQTLAVSCMQWAFETTPTGIVLPIVALSPIVVIPMSYMIDGERPSVRSLIGGLIGVAGVIALTMTRH